MCSTWEATAATAPSGKHSPVARCLPPPPLTSLAPWPGASAAALHATRRLPRVRGEGQAARGGGTAESRGSTVQKRAGQAPRALIRAAMAVVGCSAGWQRGKEVWGGRAHAQHVPRMKFTRAGQLRERDPAPRSSPPLEFAMAGRTPSS